MSRLQKAIISVAITHCRTALSHKYNHARIFFGQCFSKLPNQMVSSSTGWAGHKSSQNVGARKWNKIRSQRALGFWESPKMDLSSSTVPNT